MAQNTLYWHDYETFGIDPMRDRPVQFAGVRTDEDLNIIGEPLNIIAPTSTLTGYGRSEKSTDPASAWFSVSVKRQASCRNQYYRKLLYEISLIGGKRHICDI